MRRLLILAFIWGWSFLFIKVAVEGMSPPTVAFLRVGLGAAVLVAGARWQGLRLPRSRRYWRDVTIAAVFGNAVPFTMLAWGEERITSALTAVLNASTPMFTAIAAVAYLGDRLRGRQVFGLILGFVGVGVAAGFGGRDVADSSIWGSLAAVGAGACYGVAFAWMRRHLIAVEPIVAASGQLVMATAILLPFAVGTSLQTGITLAPNRVASIVLLGVCGTGLAYLLNYRVLAELGATKASLVTYVVPFVAVVVGIVVLDENFELRLLFGGLLIVAGIALVNEGLRSLRRRPVVPVPGPVIVAVVALVTIAGLTLTACSDGDDGGGTNGGGNACGPAIRERFDPNSAQHVLPGAEEPQYLTDPPTSGPHQPGERLSGAQQQSISRPAQVGLLEAGVVLVQYRDLSADEVQRLTALGGNDVVVAPNPELPDKVVATAWTFKQTCSSVDVDALRTFATDHVGKGPGIDE